MNFIYDNSNNKAKIGDEDENPRIFGISFGDGDPVGEKIEDDQFVRWTDFMDLKFPEMLFIFFVLFPIAGQLLNLQFSLSSDDE
uniref:Uncharacterized protein n=1 Tax=Romanomermis culicivorax TaxID=13658 RepID=A0A915J3W3_ROMCU